MPVSAGTRLGVYQITTLTPADPAGVLNLNNRTFAADGEHYAYEIQRGVSQLFQITIKP